MDNTPKGNRLHIALMGRTNVGKSSLLNLMLGQDIAITSPVAGTTTDVVEKAMELPNVWVTDDHYKAVAKQNYRRTGT